MFFCLLRKSDTRSSHPEQPLDGFAQFFSRGDEAAVFGEELALDLEAVEGREVEGQDGGVGDGQEAREFGGDGLLFRAGREEDAQALGGLAAEERLGFLACEALPGGA